MRYIMMHHGCITCEINRIEGDVSSDTFQSAIFFSLKQRTMINVKNNRKQKPQVYFPKIARKTARIKCFRKKKYHDKLHDFV